MQGETEKLKENILNKRDPELKDFKNSQPACITKQIRNMFGRTIKSVAGLPWNKELLVTIHRLNKLSYDRREEARKRDVILLQKH